MELMLNELSVTPHCNNKVDADTRAKRFAETVNKAGEKGVTHVRSLWTANEIF